MRPLINSEVEFLGCFEASFLKMGFRLKNISLAEALLRKIISFYPILTPYHPSQATAFWVFLTSASIILLILKAITIF